MIVSERGFGSRLLTVKGRTYTFDSIECLAAFEIRGDVASANIHSRLFQNLDEPSQSLHLAEAHIRHDPDVRSPMGLSLSAHAVVPNSGRVLEWNEVMEFVAKEWRLNK
jgi:copper chaperone NosL